MDELVEMGLMLGVDVFVFVRGYVVFVEGVGEILMSVDLLEKWYLVVYFGVNISISVIFKDFEFLCNMLKRLIETLLKCEFSNDCEVIVRKRFCEVDVVFFWLLEYVSLCLIGIGVCVFVEFDIEFEVC